MKSDLSKSKVGDWIATVMWGWLKITKLYPGNRYGVEFKTNDDTVNVTHNGCLYKFDKYPTAFTAKACPQWLIDIIGKKPCKFKKGDKVLLNGDLKRYFSHETHGYYYCFEDGKDAWTSNGKVNEWQKHQITAWEE